MTPNALWRGCSVPQCEPVTYPNPTQLTQNELARSIRRLGRITAIIGCIHPSRIRRLRSDGFLGLCRRLQGELQHATDVFRVPPDHGVSLNNDRAKRLPTGCRNECVGERTCATAATVTTRTTMRNPTGFEYARLNLTSRAHNRRIGRLQRPGSRLRGVAECTRLSMVIRPESDLRCMVRIQSKRSIDRSCMLIRACAALTGILVLANGDGQGVSPSGALYLAV